MRLETSWSELYHLSKLAKHKRNASMHVVVLYPFKWCVEDGDRQICVMPCSSSDHLSLSVRQKDYNDCYSSYPELHMCKRWNDTMILLL